MSFFELFYWPVRLTTWHNLSTAWSGLCQSIQILRLANKLVAFWTSFSHCRSEGTTRSSETLSGYRRYFHYFRFGLLQIVASLCARWCKRTLCSHPDTAEIQPKRSNRLFLMPKEKQRAKLCENLAKHINEKFDSDQLHSHEAVLDSQLKVVVRFLMFPMLLNLKILI